MFRKAVGLLLSVLLVFSVILPGISAGYAASSGGDAVLAFTSDVHNEPNNTSADRLISWIDAVNSYTGGTGIDFMTFCGDIGKSSTESPTSDDTGRSYGTDDYWIWVQAVMDKVEAKLGTGKAAYTTGNHEIKPEDGSMDTLHPSGSTQQEFSIEETVKTGTYYEVYCLGSRSHKQSEDGYTSSQISSLGTYLDTIPSNSRKVYFIATHYPLHTYRASWETRTTKNADSVISAVNKAVDSKNINVVFVWGHNHSVRDTNYGKVYGPGEKLNGTNTAIQFYYASAGCMSDSENVSGNAGSISAKGLVSCIASDGSTFSLAFFDKNGALIGQETRISTDRTKYTVTFNSNGHGTAPSTQSILTGKTVVKPADLTASGWKFTGWYRDSSCTEQYSFSAPVTKDITLYAGWKKIHTVSFDLNGQAAARPIPAAQSVVDGGKASKPTSPSLSGKTFKGWYTEAAGTNEFDFTASITRDLTLFAKWEDVPQDPPADPPTDPPAGEGGSSGSQGSDPGGSGSGSGSGSSGESGGGTSPAPADPGNADTPQDIPIASDAALKVAIDAGISHIDSFYTETGLSKYKTAQQIQIIRMIQNSKDSLKAASSESEAASILQSFDAYITALPKASDIDRIAKNKILLRSVKAGQKKLTVKWTSNKIFDGYQVAYRIKGGKWKAFTIKSSTSSTKAIKKLKKGKKYQVKIRGYKLYGVDSSIKVYSKYSRTLTGKVK